VEKERVRLKARNCAGVVIYESFAKDTPKKIAINILAIE
jgi:hypothetical protein